MTWFVIWGVTAIVTGFLGFILAATKNRDASAWAAWCFIFPPTLIALLFTRRNPGPPPRRRTLDEQDRETF
jgi:hypothetical protein